MSWVIPDWNNSMLGSIASPLKWLVRVWSMSFLYPKTLSQNLETVQPSKGIPTYIQAIKKRWFIKILHLLNTSTRASLFKKVLLVKKWIPALSLDSFFYKTNVINSRHYINWVYSCIFNWLVVLSILKFRKKRISHVKDERSQ